jgi:hypothetical protein
MTRCAGRALNASAVGPDVAFWHETDCRTGLAMSAAEGEAEGGRAGIDFRV